MRAGGRIATAGLALALLGAAACSDDDGDGGDAALDVSDVGDDPTFEECSTLLVDLVSQVDLEGIDTTDGIDDAEGELLDERFDALEEDNPELSEGHPCEAVMEGASEAQVEELIATLPPELVAILGFSATQELEEVEDRIG